MSSIARSFPRETPGPVSPPLWNLVLARNAISDLRGGRCRQFGTWLEPARLAQPSDVLHDPCRQGRLRLVTQQLRGLGNVGDVAGNFSGPRLLEGGLRFAPGSQLDQCHQIRERLALAVG